MPANSVPADLLSANSDDLIESVNAACSRVPPLWPLSNFVAVNPFLGLSEMRFRDALAAVHRATHVFPTLSIEDYRTAWEAQRITPQDLEEAILANSCEWTPEQLIHSLSSPAKQALARHCVADCVDSERGTSWGTLIVEDISKWCGAYFDQGQALWKMPWRNLPIFRAWKRGASIDHTMEVSGLPGFRNVVKNLPEDALLAIQTALEVLGVQPSEWGEFLHRELMTIRGWAGYVQYLAREQKLRGQTNEGLIELLAIRLAYDLALLEAFGKPASLFIINARVGDSQPDALVLWQDALEIAERRSLFSLLSASPQSDPHDARPSHQSVFCIDVRSEVFRRSLETVAPGCETIGFAGFFGIPVETLPLTSDKGACRCPVLLVPALKITEKPARAPLRCTAKYVARLKTEKKRSAVWKTFKSASLSCFSFVECLGLGYAVTLARNTLAKPGQSKKANRYNIDSISVAERVDLAEGALRGMGLTGNFSRLVLLCGHGGTTQNNPFASSLDCGACGGHAGDANARIAAMILNDPATRIGLEQAGLKIPEDTLFVAGLHDTTTDEVVLFDKDQVPETHLEDIRSLEKSLREAGQLTRSERALALGIRTTEPAKIEENILRRSRDWAEVRPEWGLAGNRLFIAAPRERTRQINLHGRAFLHNYNPLSDPGNKTLELILTAPMVVASWINLQYFASSANNPVFGSGNKVLHNVVGKLGVLEGNGGDLRSGLPLQSVHTGSATAHLPLRLNVLVEAAPENLESVLQKHPQVLELIENQWVFLHSWRKQTILQRTPTGQWRELH